MRLIDDDVAGAVHRLRTIARTFDIHRTEHVLLEIFEVSGDLEKFFAHDVRRVDELITVTKNERLLVFLDFVPDYRALWVPENQARTNARVGRIKVELMREDTVIAPLRFLETVQVLLEVFLLPERRRVDALEHLPVLIAPPVCAGGVQQLEVLQIRRVGNVRSLAQIYEGPSV